MGFYLPRAPLTNSGQWCDLLLALALASRLLELLRQNEAPKFRSGALFCAILFGAWTFGSTLVNHAPYALTLGTFELSAIFWLATQLATPPLQTKPRDKLLRAWIVSVCVLGALGFIGNALDLAGIANALAGSSGAFQTRIRIQGPCITPNMLASLGLVPWLLLYAPTEKPLFGRRPRRWLLAFLSLTLLFTLSHTLLAVALGVCILRRKDSKWWLGAGIPVIVALDFLSIRFHWTSAEQGIAPSLTAGMRWLVLGQAWRATLAHPLWGSGPGSLVTLADYRFNAHNTPLAIAATLGLPALAAFGGCVFLALRKARAARKPSGDLQHVLTAAVLALLFDSLTMDLQHARHFWLLLGLL